ncbi:hypothetical protein LTR36_007058 [Oleoguttula mirabilis]|uniref:Ribosomal protein L9 domain-containing protein n=1 Tax=Oleoguttula mirabilis TaxID=1507867 RepID=A0AAV9JBB6_9PEZI|nr:hypothetical protein LTR36_007058 [Oleoguttula mirabilis]
MALPLRPRAIPQCSACIRSYTFGGIPETISGGALRQQVRGKKKLVNTSTTVPVRLLKNVKTFGRKGAIVPISMGQMRNDWFPRRVAEYVTMPELKTLHVKNVAMERDFDFGITSLAKEAATTPGGGAAGRYQADTPTDIRGGMSTGDRQDASMFQKKPAETSRLSAERSAELVEIFVPARLDFYRQPILEEKEAEAPAAAPEPPTRRPMRGFGSGAGAELLAARTPQAEAPKPKPTGPQAIYGSVSTADVLSAIKAVMAENDEAARVVLHAEDIKFVEVATDAQPETDRVKFVGDFAVEILPKGAAEGVRRAVRVNAQEAA